MVLSKLIVNCNIFGSKNEISTLHKGGTQDWMGQFYVNNLISVCSQGTKIWMFRKMPLSVTQEILNYDTILSVAWLEKGFIQLFGDCISKLNSVQWSQWDIGLPLNMIWISKALHSAWRDCWRGLAGLGKRNRRKCNQGDVRAMLSYWWMERWQIIWCLLDGLERERSKNSKLFYYPTMDSGKTIIWQIVLIINMRN